MMLLVVTLLIYAFFFSGKIAGLAVSEGPEVILEEKESVLENNDVAIDFLKSEEYHWDHMPITYNSDSCKNTFKGKISEDIENSFYFISDRTDNSITFKEDRMEDRFFEINGRKVNSDKNLWWLNLSSYQRFTKKRGDKI